MNISDEDEFSGCVFLQLLDESYFQDVEKIKTMGSSYMAASGLSPDGQVSADSDFFAPAMENADVFPHISHDPSL